MYYLEVFKLPKHKKIKDLSKGMKMKFAVAIALSHDADFFIMDEATSGLDPFAREELLDILLEINRSKQKTFFFSSHIISDIEKIANKIIFISEGQIVLSGTKNEIKDKYFSIKGDINQLNEDIKSKSIGFKVWEDFFLAIVPKEFETDFSATHFRMERASLEDIILFLIKEKSHETTFKII